jgi:hypothetical protein
MIPPAGLGQTQQDGLASYLAGWSSARSAVLQDEAAARNPARIDGDTIDAHMTFGP